MNYLKLISIMAFMTMSTAQGQTIWNQVLSGTGKKLNAIEFPSPTVGYIAGNDSLLLKTIDGGLTWQALSATGINFFPGGTTNIVNIKFVGEDVGYLTLGPYGGVYKTYDGGLSWQQFNSNLCFTYGFFFFNEQNGFIGGSGCFNGEQIEVYNSGVSSAATISSSTWDNANMVVDIDFYDSNFGLAASRSGLILRTTDGGLNWDTIPPLQNQYLPLTSVLIVNDTLCYAGYDNVGSGFGLLMSTDAGLTWQWDMGMATFFYPAFLSLHQTGNGTIYSGAAHDNFGTGSGGLIFENADSVWNYYPADHPINGLASYNDSIVFAVGDSGYIVTNKDFSTAITAVTPTFASVKIFPNPTQNEIEITFEKESRNEIDIELFSNSGQVVFRQKHAGETNLIISLKDFSNGVYYLKISDGNDLVEVKKVIKIY